MFYIVHCCSVMTNSTTALRFSACCQPPFSRALRRLPLYMHVSRHFVNEKGTGGEICPAVVSGIVTGNAPVSYWPIFPPFLVTFPKAFANGNSAQFLPVANGRLLLFLKPLRNWYNGTACTACIFSIVACFTLLCATLLQCNGLFISGTG